MCKTEVFWIVTIGKYRYQVEDLKRKASSSSLIVGAPFPVLVPFVIFSVLLSAPASIRANFPDELKLSAPPNPEEPPFFWLNKRTTTHLP